MIADIYYACGLFYFLAQVTWIARPVKEAKRKDIVKYNILLEIINMKLFTE